MSVLPRCLGRSARARGGRGSKCSNPLAPGVQHRSIRSKNQKPRMPRPGGARPSRRSRMTRHGLADVRGHALGYATACNRRAPTAFGLVDVGRGDLATVDRPAVRAGENGLPIGYSTAALTAWYVSVGSGNEISETYPT